MNKSVIILVKKNEAIEKGFSAKMRRVTEVILSAIVLTGILALMLTSGSGCGSKPAPALLNVYYQIGQAAETSREVLTVLSTNRVSQIRTPVGVGRLFKTYEIATPGTVFVVIEVSVTNVGQSSSLSISYKDFSMKDSEGRLWSCIGYPGVNPYPSRKLATGQSAYGYIAFNMLETAVGLEMSCVLQGSPPVRGVWQIPITQLINAFPY